MEHTIQCFNEVFVLHIHKKLVLVFSKQLENYIVTSVLFVLSVTISVKSAPQTDSLEVCRESV